jgi:hypothetical protein
MILECLKSILIRKYNGYKIYIHKMSNFDVIFLLKYLIKIADVHPTIHNSKIISIQINYGKEGQYHVNFRDSYLILLSSLAKLCSSFKVENPKSLFPHLFINDDNLDYIGDVPEFNNFIKVSKLDYQNYLDSFINKI